MPNSYFKVITYFNSKNFYFYQKQRKTVLIINIFMTQLVALTTFGVTTFGVLGQTAWRTGKTVCATAQNSNKDQLL